MRELNFRTEPMEGVINYRTVVNDAHCHPWEPMPEVQPPTVTRLIEYLRQECGINPEPLKVEHTFSGKFILRYGLRKQFLFPSPPTTEELQLIEDFHKTPDTLPPCPWCGKELALVTDYAAGDNEEYHSLGCSSCDLKISRFNGLAWTPGRIIDLVINASSHKQH